MTEAPMKREDWITVDEAMERTQRSQSTIYRWINDGDVRTYRPWRGGRLLLLAEGVDEAERVFSKQIGYKKPRRRNDTPTSVRE